MDNDGHSNNGNDEHEVKDYAVRIKRLQVIARDLLKREKDHIGISKALSGMTSEDAYIIGMIISYSARPLNPKDAMQLASKMSIQDAYFMGASIGTFLHVMNADIVDML